ncbi:hypothetical protein [Mesorhizobium sp.]|uniref:hypothetical protein n=1 Tax=Mesorhizobium sp. TaxID=1871066 RepID=UPI000FE88F8F|nr:hypothetical protein [Mesorhizobium sp.]RWO89550.1 MAG: hypothetical protein EOQ96_05160 [Mesorhizobium sp.]
MLIHELRKLLIESGWPATAIADGAKIPLNVVKAMLDDEKYPVTIDAQRLQAWADNRVGLSSTGVKIFDRYRAMQTMPTAMACDPRGLKVGAKYEPGEVGPSLTITDEDATRAATADYIGRHGGGGVMGDDTKITPQKIIDRKIHAANEKAA